jgi:hypothetical protein
MDGEEKIPEAGLSYVIIITCIFFFGGGGMHGTDKWNGKNSAGEPHQNYESPATVKIFDLAPSLSLQYS